MEIKGNGEKKIYCKTKCSKLNINVDSRNEL